MIKLKCHTCGIEKEYSTEKEAYKGGWDIDIQNMITKEIKDFCGECPSAPFLLGKEVKNNMKTIQISDEAHKFLCNLMHEINTQDNRATASPYYFVVKEKEKQYSRDLDIGEGTVYVNTEEGASEIGDINDLKKWLKEDIEFEQNLLEINNLTAWNILDH